MLERKSFLISLKRQQKKWRKEKSFCQKQEEENDFLNFSLETD